MIYIMELKVLAILFDGLGGINCPKSYPFMSPVNESLTGVVQHPFSGSFYHTPSKKERVRYPPISEPFI